MKSIFIITVGIILGLAIGVVIFLSFPFLPLPVDSTLYTTFGITKPRIIGFLPYFLTNRAQQDYSSYITMLTYFGLTIGSDGHIVKLASPTQEDPPWYDLQTPAVDSRLKTAAAHNIVLSVALVSQNEDTITTLLKNPKTNAGNLLHDILPLMKKYGFRDINLDIESFENANQQKENAFITFVSTLKQGIIQNNLGTLTVDIAPVAFLKPYLINPVKVGNIADYMLIMAYDFHTVTSSNTGAVAPLTGRGVNTEFDTTTALSLAEKEINPQKIILGMPLYGYEWDSLQSTPGAATIPNTGQTASNERIETYFKTCTNCHIVQDGLAEEPDFVFQDSSSDAYFHQAYVFDQHALSERIAVTKKDKLAGVALWALGYEGQNLLKPLTQYKQTYFFNIW